nr:MAG TPA: hypothetical protein [Caudoviricetes sp.]DAY07528.1 MAG TPA: hypothetical protein [Caudoviricetes sp.]
MTFQPITHPHHNSKQSIQLHPLTSSFNSLPFMSFLFNLIIKYINANY